MGLLYEVYTLPWDSGGFKKKFFWLPVEEESGTGTVEFLTSSGDGSVTILLDKLHEAGRDLTEIVSDTTSSLIRVLDCLPDGTKSIIDEWVCERPARAHADDRKVTISGPKLKAKAFDSQTIPAFDAPTNPTKNPDHVWGGENILSDPGFENANKQNEEYEIDLDGATGGSFVLHLNGNSTNPISHNTSVGNLENEVEALPGITDVLTDKTGNGFRIEFHNPISPQREGLGLLTWTPSLTGGEGDKKLTRIVDGQILPGGSWTRSQHADASSDPHIHGTYGTDGYRLTEGSEPVRSGEFAGRINGQSQFSGIQQLIRVQPSTRHQASIWFRSSDATEIFRLVMRDRYENLIAWQNIPNSTPNVWTQVTLDFVTELADGTPISEMVFRFAQVIDHNPVPFYIDDAELRPGAPITTWGEIVNALMGFKTTEFDWIDYSTVTDDLDSGGIAWPRDESITAFFGESYGQFWDKGVDLEYEWDLRPKATPSGSLTHDLIWYGPGGMDDSPSTGIYPNASVTGGDSLTRTPAYTKVRVEGTDGRYIEAEDAVAVANFGPLEKHIRDTSLHSDDSITARANGLLNYEAANRNAVHFKIVEHPTLPRPGTHFKPGDTIPMQLPPGLEKTNKRVQSFAYTNSFPTQYLVTGSRVLSGEAAAYSLLWRLWRRFGNPERPKGGGGFGGGGGGAPTIVVAASDASERSKSKADFICIGVSDQDVIQQALSELGPGGTLWLTEGTYKCRWRSGSVSVISSNTTGISIRGLGIKASVIEVAGSPTGVGQPIIDLGGQGALVSDLTVEDHQPGTTQTVGIVVSNSYAAVQRVGGFTRGPFIEITSGANDAIVTDCWIDGTFNSGIHTSGAGVVISNCLINIDPTTSGIGVLVDGSAPDVIIENNHIYRGLGAGMNSAQGLILDTGMGTRIVNNTLIRGTIDLQAGDYGQVIGNRISEAAGVQGGQGILVQAGIYGALIADNVIQEPRGSGIEVAGAIGCIFSNNRIIDPGGAITGDGIFVANGDENHFVGNYIESFGNARYGIHIETSASERNSFLSNRLGNAADYTNAPILDNGTGTIWGNTILDGATDGGGSSSSKVVFFQAGTLTTGSGSFKLPFTLDAEIISVLLAVGTSPTGADLIVDINKNGSGPGDTIFTTQANRPTVPDGDANGVGAEAVPDVTTIAEGDYLSVDIDQVGSTIPGSDLTVSIEWRPV